MTDENEEAVTIESKYEVESKLNFNKKNTLVKVIILLLVIVFSCFHFWKYIQTPPDSFPVGEPINIELGTATTDIIKTLKNKRVIRSETALYLYMYIYHSNEYIKASKYIFDEPLSLKNLSEKLILGDHANNLVKITFIEGGTAKDIAVKAESILDNFDSKVFFELSSSSEGKLFPETYMIPQSFTANELFELLTTTFNKKINLLEEELKASDLSLDEVIILASILEREANSVESMRMVSGILQKRLAIGMPLQVDASIEYILDKSLAELKPEDLKIDSPYNTYLNKGLPPTPIGNPGIDAINAVLNPEKSNFLFYLTGDDGNFYYSKDFEEHKKNIARYLR